MTKTMDEPLQTGDAPNWAKIGEEIRCPLCDYNLRGLIDPRCPECGFRFDWPELIDPTRRLHPYVFEHHPERNVWSMWRTICGGLQPWRFWSSLHPAQPSNARRLVVYIIVVAGFVLVANLSGIIVSAARDLTAQNSSERAWFAGYSRNPRSAEWMSELQQEYGSLDAYLDEAFPKPASWAFVKQLFISGSEILEVAKFNFIYVSWPLLTCAALLIFQWSMKRAKVNPRHVLRCVAYSFDMAVWVGVLGIAATVLVAASGRMSMMSIFAMGALIALECLSLLFMIHRLWVAYRRYLRFDRPFATIVASQVIVGLTALNVLLVAYIW